MGQEPTLPAAARRRDAARTQGRTVRGNTRSCALIDATLATDDDWDAEFLDIILAVRFVDSLDDAIAHIRRHG